MTIPKKEEKTETERGTLTEQESMPNTQITNEKMDEHMTVGDSGDEEGEILGDESDQEIVNINKANFELKKFKDEKKKKAEDDKLQQSSSVPGSKSKDYNFNQTDSEQSSAHGSKLH